MTDAQERFEAHLTRAQDALAAIARLVDDMRVLSRKRPEDYGVASSMGHVATKLEELEQFLRGNE